MNSEPVIIFSITEHSEGIYAVKLFGGEFFFNVNPISAVFNRVKSAIPAQSRLVFTAYRVAVDVGYNANTYLKSHF